jgi:pimeloyl-ACP methyl ester carboxylesterase
VYELEIDRADQEAPDKDMLPPIQVPTLVITGEKDSFNFFPLTQENLADLVPHVTIKSIPDGSHVMIYDHAEQVNAMIQEFLAG